MSSTKYVLTVTVPDCQIFNAYWYGIGEIKTEVIDSDGRITYVVDYGSDGYRANYQADRFASGLYFAKVDEVEVVVAGGA